MMQSIQSVCVFCGASANIPKRYHEVAAEFGRILASNNVTLIFGGGSVGLMGTLADTCLKEGGQVIGVMPEFLYVAEGARVGDKELSELMMVGTMHERKRIFFERSDGFVILPGGVGTLDEVTEVISWRQLGMHAKPVVMLNMFGYWDGFLQHQLPHMIQEGFVKANSKDLFSVCEKPEDVLELLRQVYRGQTQFVSKWG